MASDVLKGLVFGLCFVPALAGVAAAQDVFAYPSKGQSPEQQEQDEFQCFNWAKQKSGFDPMAAPTTSRPPPREQDTGPGVLGGAARGAIVGVIGGAIADDVGKGAAIGATAGGLLGGMRSNRRKRENDQERRDWERQETQRYANERNTYNRAYSACMQARGYTIS